MSAGTLDRLIAMANQIAHEFANQRPGEAAQATYDHLWHFWDPRMRSLILAHLASGGAGLSEDAREAVGRLQRSTGEPRSVTKATEFNKAGDHEGDRSLLSDAG
jgi:formate dehydrogenase subunit delta